MDPDCGALPGCAMSGGLHSTTRVNSPFASQTPYPLSADAFAKFTDATLSNREFRAVLDEHLA